jgi:RNA polymerase sigma-70 factor (ECF subfamily)
MLNLGRKTQERAEDPRLSSYPDAADNPELAYLKRVYRREFGEAFAASIERLSTRERNLLRYITTEGLSVDSVAALYGVHKATVNRWLAEARRTLLSCVRDHLCRRLSIGATELDSILVMIGSHFDVALPDVPHMRDGAE